jgi:hypothetical protein
MHRWLDRRPWALAGLLASSAGAAERATWAGQPVAAREKAFLPLAREAEALRSR